jgi:hypothetical protein
MIPWADVSRGHDGIPVSLCDLEVERAERVAFDLPLTLHTPDGPALARMVNISSEGLACTGPAGLTPGTTLTVEGHGLAASFLGYVTCVVQWQRGSGTGCYYGLSFGAPAGEALLGAISRRQAYTPTDWHRRAAPAVAGVALCIATAMGGVLLSGERAVSAPPSPTWALVARADDLLQERRGTETRFELVVAGMRAAEGFWLADPTRYVVDVQGGYGDLTKADYAIEHPALTGLRIGEHEGKTRFVFDASDKIPATVEPLADRVRVHFGN